MNLVDNWFKYLDFCNKSHAQGLREINQALGTGYRSNNLYRWRSGTVPDKKVMDFMRLCCARLVIEGETLKTIPEHVAHNIAKELS